MDPRKDIWATSAHVTARDAGRVAAALPQIQVPTQAQITARDAGRQ